MGVGSGEVASIAKGKLNFHHVPSLSLQLDDWVSPRWTERSRS